MQLILASGSRYRKEMLERLRIPFTTESPDIDETQLPNELPHELALRLAKAKASKVYSKNQGAIVIGCDQVAAIGQTAIGKPGSFEAAFEQLKRLSGQEVVFNSAICVTDGHNTLTNNIITLCRFRDLSEHEIHAYLNADQPFDTAGSAKAESLGITIMQSIKSDDPTAIIGLPLIELSNMLRELGINPTTYNNYDQYQ